MELNDVVAVIGLENPATERVEALCRSIGMRVFYAVKKADPSQRIASCDADASVSSPFEDLPNNVFRLGFMAADSLVEDGTLDCNLTKEHEMFEQVREWGANRGA